ncbi:HSPB1-associated protein 1 [Pelodytes ibericus]
MAYSEPFDVIGSTGTCKDVMDENLQMRHPKKPFTPQEAREIVLALRQPAVFTEMVGDWPALRWTAHYLSSILEENPLRFRIGRKTSDNTPQFETYCEYVDGTLNQFVDWASRTSHNRPGPFDRFDTSDHWAYADYKYLARIFNDQPEILKDIVWADFGFPGRDGQESTLWVGSSGANTPCHIDSYGCNLVLQVEGRKTWHLFPPEDTAHLYPTRIPYEESSIFSNVNIVSPDWSRFPLYSKARPHVVTLHPGQVLVVPHHWWHYVESIDDVTVSINSWIELDSDHEARVEEAVTRLLVCSFKSAENSGDVTDWLNPTEGEVTSHETNLRYLNQALAVYTEHEKEKESEIHSERSKEDSPLIKRKRLGEDVAPESNWSTTCPPFGKHLLPVTPKGETVDIVLAGGHRQTPQDTSHTRNATSNICPYDAEGGATSSLTSNDVLDCLSNPQVIRLVTQLLLQKQIL